MDEVKQFFENANIQLERAYQAEEEAAGNTVKIEYDERILRLFQTADATYILCKRLKSGINEWLNPNQVERFQDKLAKPFLNSTTTRPAPSTQLANDQLRIAQGLCEDSELALVLSTYSAALTEIGRSEQSFIVEAQKGILTTLNTFVKKQWQEIQKERRRLEDLRLDYGSLLRKLEFATDEDTRKSLMEKCIAAKRLFDSQLCSTKLVLEQIPKTQIQTLLVQGLKQLVAEQVKHLEYSFEVMHNLTEALGPPQTPGVW